MKTLFQSFVEMANGLPPQAILHALDRESRVIESDLARYRIFPLEDSFSIVAFRRFVDVVLNFDKLLPIALPVEHVKGFRRLISRLVRSKQLPRRAMREFDETFSAAEAALDREGVKLSCSPGRDV